MDKFKKGTLETSELFQYFYRNAPYGTNKLEYARDMYFKAQQSSFYPNLSWEARFIVSKGGSRPDSYHPNLLEIAQWMSATSDKTPDSTTQTSSSAAKTTPTRSTSNDKIYQSPYSTTKGQKQPEQQADQYFVTPKKPSVDNRVYQSRYNSPNGQKERLSNKQAVTPKKLSAPPQYKNLKQLQQFLQTYGYYDESGMNSRAGNDDGIMGPKTLKAIQRLGVEMGIYDGQIDGLMGPKTRKVLNHLLRKGGLEEQRVLQNQELERERSEEAAINNMYAQKKALNAEDLTDEEFLELYPETQKVQVFGIAPYSIGLQN